MNTKTIDDICKSCLEYEGFDTYFPIVSIESTDKGFMFDGDEECLCNFEYCPYVLEIVVLLDSDE